MTVGTVRKRYRSIIGTERIDNMAYNYYPYNYYAQQQIQPQIQNGGIIKATEDEARKYPVAQGYSMMFIDDENKMLYTKTQGFSQLDTPVFEKYKLIKEKTAENSVSDKSDESMSQYMTKAEFERFFKDYEQFKKEVLKDE